MPGKPETGCRSVFEPLLEVVGGNHSRLAVAGVDLLTILEVGGWRSLAVVQRYAHLIPRPLHAAVERLVAPGAAELARNQPAVPRRVTGAS